MKKGRVPIERALSKLGLGSRTQTRQWIAEGSLQADGETIRDPGFPVIPEKTRFTLRGVPLLPKKNRLLLFYKPEGVVTTRSDEKGRKTVYDVLPLQYRELQPVGRLDKDTTGLLLFTDNSRLAAYLTDPIFHIERVYEVWVEGEVSSLEAKSLLSGVSDRGEMLRAVSVRIEEEQGGNTRLTLVLEEGKNREIRRMCSVIGHPVVALKRISFGPFRLGELRPGECIEADWEKVRENLPDFYRHEKGKKKKIFSNSREK